MRASERGSVGAEPLYWTPGAGAPARSLCLSGLSALDMADRGPVRGARRTGARDCWEELQTPAGYYRYPRDKDYSYRQRKSKHAADGSGRSSTDRIST